jgi:hypothetical protein
MRLNHLAVYRVARSDRHPILLKRTRELNESARLASCGRITCIM